MGSSSSRNLGFSHKLQLEGTSTAPHSISNISNRADIHAGSLDFGKTRGSSLGSNTIVQDDDFLGHIIFRGADGTDVSSIAVQISAAVDGAPGSNDMPGRLEFKTTADGASNPTQRMVLDSSGRLVLGGASSRAIGFEHRLQIEDTNDTPHGFSMISNRANQFGPHMSFAKSRGSSRGSSTVVQDNDELATLIFRGADGTDINTTAAMIDVRVDGTPGSNNVPGSFEFHTQNTSGTVAKRLIINSSGHLMPGADSVYNIGSSSVRHANIYADAFTGNLTGNADTATLATRATDLAINGTNQLLYQASNNDSAILPTGNAGQILQSNGSGNAPQWVTSAPAGAIEGITVRDESSIVGSANSISTINFVGQAVTADAAALAGIATVTIDAISGVLVKAGGANAGTAITAFDFKGSLVDVDAISNTGIATVQVDGLTVKDEGSTVGTANSITSFNFVGDVVTATASGETATVTVNAIAGLGVSEGSGAKATGATGLDFVGPVVSVDAASNTGISTVRVEGLSIKDEGSTVGTAGSITTINFVGAGIAAAVSGETATVTSSGASTDDVVALAIALG